MPSKSAAKAPTSTPTVTPETAVQSFKKLKVYSKDFGASGVLGLAVGVCAKRLSSDALYGFGIGFLGLQTLNYLGYIQINWKKVEDDATKVADQNKDGKVDYSDFKVLLDRFIKFAGHGLSSMGGFTSGFFLGAKYLA